jgi:hypothetical protein
VLFSYSDKPRSSLVQDNHMHTPRIIWFPIHTAVGISFFDSHGHQNFFRHISSPHVPRKFLITCCLQPVNISHCTPACSFAPPISINKWTRHLLPALSEASKTPKYCILSLKMATEMSAEMLDNFYHSSRLIPGSLSRTNADYSHNLN